jgi:DNA-binding MarR family transcriptional regulator
MLASAAQEKGETTHACLKPWPEHQKHIEAARAMRRARRRRSRFFEPTMFSDPAWDILLELYIAEWEQRRLSITALSDRSGVAGTTVLRWLELFEREGLISKRCDPLDRRRVYVSLSALGPGPARERHLRARSHVVVGKRVALLRQKRGFLETRS